MTQIEELFPNIDKLSVVLRKSLHTALSGGYKRTDYEKAFERLFKLLLEAEEFIETEDDKEHWDSEAQAAVFYYFAAMERELISVPEYSELDLLCAEFIDKVELPESIAKKLAFGTLSDFLEKNPMPVMSDYLARVKPPEIPPTCDLKLEQCERILERIRPRLESKIANHQHDKPSCEGALCTEKTQSPVIFAVFNAVKPILLEAERLAENDADKKNIEAAWDEVNIYFNWAIRLGLFIAGHE